MLGKIEGRRRWGQTEDEMVGWHHQLDEHEFEQTPGVGEGPGSPACCSPQGHKESDTTEHLKRTDVIFGYTRALLCMRAFSSCEEWGLLSGRGAQAPPCAGFSRRRAGALGCTGFRSSSTRPLECLCKQLRCPGVVVPRHVESSRARDPVHVPCTGRETLTPCTTRGVQSVLVFRSSLNAYSSFKALNGLAAIKQSCILPSGP